MGPAVYSFMTLTQAYVRGVETRLHFSGHMDSYLEGIVSRN
jgi:hypothetical protein